MINNIGWQGKYEIYSNGELIDTIYNRITNQAITVFRDVLKGTSASYAISHIAIGTSSAAVTGAETQLGAEIFRTPDVSQIDVSFQEIKTAFVVLDLEAVGTWQEIGIFANGTATANSGFLLSRILFTKVKSANEEITVYRYDSFNK